MQLLFRRNKYLILVCLYSIIQTAGLFLLRKWYLMTVYQTVAAYGAVCMAGIILLVLSASGKSAKGEGVFSRLSVCMLRDCYLVFWSGIHGIIVLGFLTCGTFYLTLTQITVVQIVNIFLGIVLYWLIYIISGSVIKAVGLGNLLIGAMGTVNYYLVRFRGAPFRLSDIKAVKTAGNVVQNYNFMPDILLVVCLIDLILWYVVWKLYFSKLPSVKGRNICSISLSVLLICGCIALPVMRFDEIYKQTGQFVYDTYLADLLAEIMGRAQTLPDDYSAEKAEEIMEAFMADENRQKPAMINNRDNSRQPNIVVIMNEAFSDLRIFGELETTEPVWGYWDSISDNVIRGWANVSVLGGTTANSEYEFLSSDPTGVYGDVIPYNNYFQSGEPYEGLVSVLKAQGYETTAFHPYLASGWNRPMVYRAMQFDNILFENDIEELDSLRHYVSDKGDYSYIMQWFEEKESGIPQFFFNVTMQNHGGYTYSGSDFEVTVQLTGEAQGRYPQAEQYLSLVKASDEALEGLLTYFEAYEEPVVVVMFGDHQPKLEDGFYEYITGKKIESWSLEQRMNQYKTPFIIWHNYDMEGGEIGDVSLNYLASILLEELGLDMSVYQEYALCQYAQLPVINILAVMDTEGKLYARGSREYADMVSEYRLLAYYHTADNQSGRMEFFQADTDRP